MGCVIGLIIGCAYDRVIMSDSLNWIKNDEWFVSRLLFFGWKQQELRPLG